jgi:hypothetical protein
MRTPQIAVVAQHWTTEIAVTHSACRIPQSPLLLSFFLLLFLACTVATASPVPDLSGQTPEWVKTTKGCWLYTPLPQSGEQFDWTGACVNQVASGMGEEIQSFATSGTSMVFTGNMVNGVLQGNVTRRDSSTQTPNQLEMSAPMVDGEWNGRGYMILKSNNRATYRYVGDFQAGIPNGTGRETSYNADGTISEDFNGAFVHGRPSGPPVATSSPAPNVALGNAPAGSTSNAHTASAATNSTQTGSIVGVQSAVQAPAIKSPQGTPFTFLGIPLGSDPRNEFGKCDRASESLCIACGIFDDGKCESPSFGGLPDLGFGYSVSATLFHKVAMEITLSTFAVNYDALKRTAIEKYGTGYKRKVKTYELVDGGSAIGEIYTWTQGKTMIVLFQIYDNVNQSALVVMDTVLEDMQAAESESNANKAAKSNASKL